MKHISVLKYICIFSILLAVTGCHDMDYYQKNPNAPSVATPQLLLPNICVKTLKLQSQLDAAYSSRYVTYYGRPVPSMSYDFEEEPFRAYDVLRQVNDMQRIAAESGETAYVALAKFFRAYLFLYETECLGDIPYSEALNKAVPRPEYDTQKEVYLGILNELEEANGILDPARHVIVGDIVFGGNVVKWKQAINALSLRILIHLSSKEADADLDVKGRFGAILGNASEYPLMGSNDDNFQLVYNPSAESNYSSLYMHQDLTSSVSMESGLVGLLVEREDKRLFKIAEPVSGMPGDVFNSYTGINAGLPVSEQMDQSNSASRIALRYYSDPINEPLVMLGYSEQEFLIAEAVARGWVAGGAEKAKTHYENGITASMAYYGITDDADVDPYLAHPKVDYSLAADKLELIAVQKYISMFMNYGWEPFFEHRRTGHPSFNTGAGTGNGGQIPKRWIYPQSEYNTNEANVKQAVQRQFGGTDDINQSMWILQ